MWLSMETLQPIRGVKAAIAHLLWRIEGEGGLALPSGVVTLPAQASFTPERPPHRSPFTWLMCENADM